MKVSELLAQAFGLWSSMPTKGVYMRDKDGHPMDPWNPDSEPCSMCSMGALYRVTGKEKEDETFHSAIDLLNESARALTRESGIISVNDYQSFETTKSVWLKAIELAKANEGCAA